MLRRIVLLVLLLSLLTACRNGTLTTPTPTTLPPTDTIPPPPQATHTPTPSPSPTLPPPAPTTPAPSAAGEVVTFESEDGLSLTGTFYAAPGAGPAPAVMLMHQMNSSRQVWLQKGLVDWLAGRTPPAGADIPAWPPLPEGQAFAVFIFDFRGHGDSQGQFAETADFLVDAKAALAYLQARPEVDPERIVLIGASIGADAAVDVCGDGCLGALSLSPGGYLDVPYSDVVGELGLDAKPAWCIVAQSDGLPAQTCATASGTSYRAVVYPGADHGIDLLKPGRQPDIAALMLEFLRLAFDF